MVRTERVSRGLFDVDRPWPPPESWVGGRTGHDYPHFEPAAVGRSGQTIIETNLPARRFPSGGGGGRCGSGAAGSSLDVAAPKIEPQTQGWGDVADLGSRDRTHSPTSRRPSRFQNQDGGGVSWRTSLGLSQPNPPQKSSVLGEDLGPHGASSEDPRPGGTREVPSPDPGCCRRFLPHPFALSLGCLGAGVTALARNVRKPEPHSRREVTSPFTKGGSVAGLTSSDVAREPVVDRSIFCARCRAVAR